MKLSNLELNVNLSNPVIFFDLDDTTYVLLIDGSEQVLNGDMDGVDYELTTQLNVCQNFDRETTEYEFNDFKIIYCNSEVTCEVK